MNRKSFFTKIFGGFVASTVTNNEIHDAKPERIFTTMVSIKWPEGIFPPQPNLDSMNEKEFERFGSVDFSGKITDEKILSDKQLIYRANLEYLKNKKQ